MKNKRTYSDYKKIVKQITSEILPPVCKEYSFTQKGDSFYRQKNDLVKNIDVEYFHWNTDISFSFWFNIGILHWPYGENEDITKKKLLENGESMFFKRSGFLWNNENHMYTLRQTTNKDELQERIKEDFTEYVFPFFESFHNIDDVVRFLEEENRRLQRCEYSFRLAIFMARMGRKKESKKYFKESIGVKEAIVIAARYFGIDLSD
jgi:hypothetical protein